MIAHHDEHMIDRLLKNLTEAGKLRTSEIA